MVRKQIPRALLTLLLAGLASCAPGPEVTEPTPGELGQVSLSATSTKGTATFNFDQVHFWDCIGEDIHNVFQVTYDYTLIQLPSGEYVYRELWPNGKAVGTVTGLTSGHVWQRNIQASPFVDRSTGGGMTHWTYQGRFVSATGPTIDVHEVFHLSRDANGEVRVDSFKSSCRVK